MIYRFRLDGITPLLIHADDVEASDRLDEWRKDPQNKDRGARGDDRSPAWAWKTYLYTDGVSLTIPADNLMVCLREAGASIPLRGKLTYKSLTQCGLLLSELQTPLLVNDAVISHEAITQIDGKFPEQAAKVRDHGFRLFVKRARVGQAKHVRVRPRFDTWALEGRVEVIADDAITVDVLRKLFETAGRYKGLCDWRPSEKQSPGPYGTFRATVERAK